MTAGATAPVNAHTLTLLFHRLLTEREWMEVLEYVHAHPPPFVVALQADSVLEPADRIVPDGTNPTRDRS